jgi:hypothetical protein
MSVLSPEQIRRLSISTSNLPPVSASSNQSRMYSAGEYGSGSPQKVTTTRTFGRNVQHLESPRGPVQNQRRDSLASQASPSSLNSPGRASFNSPGRASFNSPGRASFNSLGRASFNSSLRAPTMMQGPDTSSLAGVPETLAVQEMAFRQGQRDTGSSLARLPPSPFIKHYDQVWAQYYKFGKAVGGTPVTSTFAGSTASHQNFPWPILINPYTQDLQRPTGVVDSQWARKICEIALNCMEELVRVVCKRQGDWRKTICDVPSQVQQALAGFPDLRARYECLKRDATEAVAGGLPAGYLV